MPAITSGRTCSSRFVSVFAVLLCLFIGTETGVSADANRTELIRRFDAQILPIVEKAAEKPVTDRGGEIAWGTSYQLGAIVEMLEATGNPKYAQRFVKLSDWVVASRDNQHGRRDEVRGQVAAAWSSTNYSKGVRYTWAVHTGMIAEPMARFAAVVRRNPALAKQWSSDADRLLRVAEEAVAVHDEDYRAGPGPNEGYLYSPYLKKHLPLNMQNALARAWLAIDDANKAPKRRENISHLAQFMKNRLRPMDDGSYVWAYWPALQGKTETFEDISHAAINVDFMTKCFEHDIVFRKEDLARLDKTLLNRVIAANDRISDTVGGPAKYNTHRSAVLRWERLGRHSSEVRKRIMDFSQQAEFTNDLTALAANVVYLTLPGKSSATTSSK